MEPAVRGRTFSFRITVLGMLLIVVSLTTGLALGLHYYFSRDLAITAAERTFLETSEKVEDRIRALDKQSAELVTVLGHFKELESFPDQSKEHLVWPLLSDIMKQNKNLFAIYIGYDNGDYYEVINLESSENVRKSLQAAAHDRWVVVKISGKAQARTRERIYLDDNLKARSSISEPTTYDPRGRPWFTQAINTPGIIKTSPYLFFNIHAPGVTYAESRNDGQHVIAVDISLASMSNFLERQRLIPGSEAFLFDEKGNITAQTTKQEDQEKSKHVSLKLSEQELAYVKANPTIRASNEKDWPPYDFSLNGMPRGYSIDMLNMLAARVGLTVKYVNGYDWGGLVNLFNKGDIDLLHSLMRTEERESMGNIAGPYLVMPQVFAYRNGRRAPTFNSLKGKTVAIPKDWRTATYLRKNHPEIKLLQVGTTLDAMRAVSDGRADATLDNTQVLKYLASAYFLKGIKFSEPIPKVSGFDLQGLNFLVRPEKPELASILTKALSTISDEDKARLNQKWFGKKGAAGNDKPLANGTVPHPQLLALAKETLHEGALKTIRINNQDFFGYVSRLRSDLGSDEFVGFVVPVDVTIEPYMSKVWISLIITIGMFLFLVPIVWYCSSLVVKPIRALADENQKVKERQYDAVHPVNSNITEIIELSDSMVDMVSSIKAYEQSLRDLMDAFIKLIATAIDQKSPYTGAHCERVPILSEMLAKAANESTSKAFAEFSITTEDEWREFRVASWLHDCGKVTTPEHVVDKATKLETIYNRIHEVRMRFEVLLRDAEIEYWKGRFEGGDESELIRTLETRRAALKDDFAFIAECNVGNEFMGDDKAERVREISKQVWIRHFDDRLGLGPLEVLRYPQEASPLPREERLLSDRPEHLIARNEDGRLGDIGTDFPIDAPEHLYNLGEIYNLCISRGTLTAEERFKINEHIVATIHMLETLPFPENMARIPEYAGAHHETLIGTGYPRKLNDSDISIPARIIAIADVFEALTASDRPYKKAKTIDEAVRILVLMVKDQHLDADLVRLFLESGVYMEYAQKLLDPGQIDEVNVAGYVEELSRISD